MGDGELERGGRDNACQEKFLSHFIDDILKEIIFYILQQLILSKQEHRKSNTNFHLKNPQKAAPNCVNSNFIMTLFTK